MQRILGHLRSNLVGYVAIFFAVVVAPTSAYAVATIRSADIVDGEVKAVDLGNNAVRSPKILDGEVQAVDLGNNVVRSPKILDRSISNQDLSADSITTDKIAQGGVIGDDIADNTISGLDVNETTLATVPSALQGGLGRSDPTGSCDPESTTYMACSTAQITLSQPARLFVIGTVRAYAEASADEFIGDCRINTTRGPIDSTRDTVDGDNGDGDGDFYDSLTMHAVSDVFPAGTSYVWIECNERPWGAIGYDLARISVIGLSAG